MQSTLGCLTRIVFSRSLVTGVVNPKEATSTTTTTNTSKATLNSTKRVRSRLITAVSGFPKRASEDKAYNIDNILKGQIGDDAYFVARHVDDWNNNVFDVHVDSSDKKTSAADIIGVADGVGGWREYGVDPGQFSSALMRNCERLAVDGRFARDQPAKLLAQGYLEMRECRKRIVGSSTACVMILSHSDLRLHTANIGDSGFLVVRDGRVVHRSREQQHFFNTPFQLSLPPAEVAAGAVLTDPPEAADTYEFKVRDGDVILLATDGLFDNVPDALLVDEMSALHVETTPKAPLDVRLQQRANSIALMAMKLSRDAEFVSPFAENARANGMKNVVGGKEDDITVILAAVKLEEAADL